MKNLPIGIQTFQKIRDKIDLGSFDVDDIKIETLLFQTGYLTIKKVKTINLS